MKIKKILLGASVFVLAACAPATLSVAEAKSIAEGIQSANAASFAAPTNVKYVMNQSMKMTMTGDEDYVTTTVGSIHFNTQEGFFLYSVEETTDGESESLELYFYVDGSDLILATNILGGPVAVKTPCPDAASAKALAVSQLADPEGMFVDFIDSIVAGCAGATELQSVIGFLGQIEANTDEDTTNDVNNGYNDKYDIAFTAASANEGSLDITFTLDGAGSEEEAGFVSSGSVVGTFKATFVDYRLTYSLDDAVLTETQTYGDEKIEFVMESKTENTISYDAAFTAPDLTGYTF